MAKDGFGPNFVQDLPAEDNAHIALHYDVQFFCRSPFDKQLLMPFPELLAEQ